MYVCPRCHEVIPTLYVRDYRRYPPVVVSIVGRPGHGKTVFTAALFASLLRDALAHHWPGFCLLPLNEDSLDTVYANVDLLQAGHLPPATPKIFPRPTLVRLEGTPLHPDRTLLFYDTGGEPFEQAAEVEQYASFIRRAQTALFLVNVPGLRAAGEPVAESMRRLLTAYVQAMGQLGKIDQQHLVVVFTSGDALLPLPSGWEDVETYLQYGALERALERNAYLWLMNTMSNRLRAFTMEVLEARPFLHLAESRFKSVHFSVISSLGAAPQEERLPYAIAPRRILDPVLWMMEQTLSGWRQALRRREADAWGDVITPPEQPLKMRQPVQFALDPRTGFPTVLLRDIGLEALMWPITAPQYEAFRAANPARPAVSTTLGLFASGVLPDEATALAAWMGDDFAVPTTAQWRRLYRATGVIRLRADEWEALRNVCPPELVKGSMQSLLEAPAAATLREVMRLDDGLIEWVCDDAQWRGMGHPLPTVYPNLYTPPHTRLRPTDPAARLPAMGVRLVRPLT